MKALIIYNPVAGQRSYLDEVNQAVEFLADQGWDVLGVEVTHGPGDATTYARRAVACGCDVVLQAGGDGTLAQTVDGLVGSETALGVLPTGTGNVFARQLRLPVPGGLHPYPVLESAKLLLDGQVKPVDVGRVLPKGKKAPARHFLCWSGIGFDAQVNLVMAGEQERKKRLGLGAFIVTAFLTARDFAGTRALVRVDGHRISRRMVMLVANNIQLYGVFFRMASTAILDDGWLDVYCFQGRGFPRMLLHAGRLLLGRHVQDPEVDIYRAHHVEVSTSGPLPVHVDGDFIGFTPVVIEVVPRALRLLVPPCAPASLFLEGREAGEAETTWEWMMRKARNAHTAIRIRSGLS